MVVAGLVVVAGVVAVVAEVGLVVVEADDPHALRMKAAISKHAGNESRIPFLDMYPSLKKA